MQEKWMNFNKMGWNTGVCGVGFVLKFTLMRVVAQVFGFLAWKSLVMVLEYVLCDMYLERDLSSTKSSNMR